MAVVPGTPPHVEAPPSTPPAVLLPHAAAWKRFGPRPRRVAGRVCLLYRVGREALCLWSFSAQLLLRLCIDQHATALACVPGQSNMAFTMAVPAVAQKGDWVDMNATVRAGIRVRLLVSKHNLTVGTVARVEAVNVSAAGEPAFTVAPEPHPAKAQPVCCFGPDEVQAVLAHGVADEAFQRVSGVNATAEIDGSANPNLRLFSVG